MMVPLKSRAGIVMPFKRGGNGRWLTSHGGGLRVRFPDSFWAGVVDLSFVLKCGQTWTKGANTVEARVLHKAKYLVLQIVSALVSCCYIPNNPK